MINPHRMDHRGAAQMGTVIGVYVMVHEVEMHGGSRCMEIRKDVLAFMAHCMHIRPSELDEIKRLMLDHLKEGCTCGEGRELET